MAMWHIISLDKHLQPESQGCLNFAKFQFMESWNLIKILGSRIPISNPNTMNYNMNTQSIIISLFRRFSTFKDLELGVFKLLIFESIDCFELDLKKSNFHREKSFNRFIDKDFHNLNYFSVQVFARTLVDLEHVAITSLTKLLSAESLDGFYSKIWWCRIMPK